MHFRQRPKQKLVLNLLLYFFVQQVVASQPSTYRTTFKTTKVPYRPRTLDQTFHRGRMAPSKMKTLETDYERALSSQRSTSPNRDTPDVEKKLTLIIKHYLPHLIDSEGRIVGQKSGIKYDPSEEFPDLQVQQAKDMWLQSLTPNLAVEPRNRRMSTDVWLPSPIPYYTSPKMKASLYKRLFGTPW